MTKFRDVFVKDIYEDIPQIFKQLYENGEIPEDVYDYFLVDIGVSKDLIDALSSQEKLIFIKSLADFQKYKSTVEFINARMATDFAHIEEKTKSFKFCSEINKFDLDFEFEKWKENADLEKVKE